jgi:hypothetical protein
MELTPGVNLVYRFELRKVPSPLKFEIIYKNMSALQSNLEVYMSTFDKNPSGTSCEVKFLS